MLTTQWTLLSSSHWHGKWEKSPCLLQDPALIPTRCSHLAADTASVSSPVLMSRYWKRSGRTAVLDGGSCLLVSSPQPVTIDHTKKGLHTEVCTFLSSLHNWTAFLWELSAHTALISAFFLYTHLKTQHSYTSWKQSLVSAVCSYISLPHRGWFATRTPYFMDLTHSCAWKTGCRTGCFSQHLPGAPVSIPSSINDRNATNGNDLWLLFTYITVEKLHTAETEHINSIFFSHVVKVIFLLVSYQWYLHRASKGKRYSTCQWDHLANLVSLAAGGRQLLGES